MWLLVRVEIGDTVRLRDGRTMEITDAEYAPGSLIVGLAGNDFMVTDNSEVVSIID